MDDTIIRNFEEDNKYFEVAEKCYQRLLKWKYKLGTENATVKKLCNALQKVCYLKALEALRNMSRQCDS